MCGIAGAWIGPPGETGGLAEAVREMATALAHRGPDDSGVFVDAPAGLALSFRRLAIIDLSPAGHQPMRSADGRYVLAYNGEIYNAEELRAELTATGVRFCGHSDTEVLVEALARWGIDGAVGRLIGMFAFAVWDVHERVLTLVRDRLGIKPLYYWHDDRGTVLFGSELKALMAHRACPRELDLAALQLYFRFAYVPAPLSIFRGVRKLLPGHIIEFRAGRPPLVRCYWSARDVVERGLDSPIRGSDDELVECLDSMLRDAVGRRMVADVPLGAFLSGGIDSSVVVALMQAQSSSRVRTFSIGFELPGYNEAVFAARVAAHLGTDHTEQYVTPDEALAVVPELADIYDEPFADSSQIPTLLVSRLARRSVTVSLSGDGGDELFAGYNRHVWADRAWSRLARVPRVARRAGARLLAALGPDAWDRLYASGGPRVRRRLPMTLVGEKLHKTARVLDARNVDELYLRLVSQWQFPERLLAAPPVAPPWGESLRSDMAMVRMMFRDLVTYLPDDILTKLDRASMAVGLEGRVPLLDHRIVEWSWRLPPDLKRRGAIGKWILRQVLRRYVPEELFTRPKSGFGIPIDAWLRGPLRAWAEDLLSERALRDSGLEPILVRDAWTLHLSGRANRHHELWTVLMYQAWRHRWLGTA